MKKSDVNAAIVSIKPVDLEINTSSSITQTLAGRAAGLTVLGGSVHIPVILTTQFQFKVST
jgi:hypothetical protein